MTAPVTRVEYVRGELASLQRQLRFDSDADAEQMAYGLADVLGRLIAVVDIIIERTITERVLAPEEEG
jgi:hypothetical protein